MSISPFLVNFYIKQAKFYIYDIPYSMTWRLQGYFRIYHYNVAMCYFKDLLVSYQISLSESLRELPNL